MLKKIAVEELKTGMYLQSLCGSWMDHPFWRTKFVITDPLDIQKIVDSGITEVWINLDKGTEPQTAVASTTATEPIKPEPEVAPKKVVERPKPTQTSDEMQRAAKICAQAKKSVKSMFEEARMGKAISIDHAGEVVQEISFSVMRKSERPH